MTEISLKTAEHSEELEFAAETDSVPPEAAPGWKLLIVDDEQEVHVITKMVLAGMTFSGRELTFLSAHSAREAREILLAHNDIALILLDVVMETGQAGLGLVEFIRNDLKNSLVRIILRTGQPGQAPERDVIVRYDINDYKHKTELTAQKLFSVVTTAIRSYNDLQTIEKSRRGLEQIISATRSLYRQENIRTFAAGVLDQICAMLQLDDRCYFLHAPSGFAATVVEGDISVIAGTGEYGSCGDSLTPCAIDTGARDVLNEAVRQRHGLFTDDAFVQYFRSRRGSENLLYFQLNKTLTDFEKRLIQVFSGNVAVALDNMQLNAGLMRTQKELIFTLGDCVESRSKETASHVRRVSACCHRMAVMLGHSEQEAELIRLAAPMHDVGKIGIPDDILLKPDPLSPADFAIMKTHTEIGYRILNASPRTIMQSAAIIAHEHHEWWNGNGYPRGLSGDSIHPYGRMACLVDVFDSLLSRRVYKEPWVPDRVRDYVIKQRGQMFDPAMADILLSNFDEFLVIRDSYPDTLA